MKYVIIKEIIDYLFNNKKDIENMKLKRIDYESTDNFIKYSWPWII